MNEDLARLAMAQMYSPEDPEYEALVREERNERYQWHAQSYREMKEEDWNDFEDEEQDFDDDDYPY